MDRQRGFNLTELVFVTAILAGLVGWGVPTFRDVARNSARTREINKFVHALHLARSEAIKRSGVVSLCPSRDGARCVEAGSSWSDGWIVFENADRDSPAARDEGELLLHAFQAWPEGVIASNRNTLSFRPFGQAGVTATVTFCDDRGDVSARAVIISQTGRPRVSDRNSSGGPLSCAQ